MSVSRAGESPYRSVGRIILIVIASALSLYLIVRLRQPIGWLIAAAFVAVAVGPPINRLGPYGSVVIGASAALVAIPVGLGAIMLPPFVNQGTELAGDLPTYANDFTKFVRDNQRLRELDAKYDLTGKIEDQADQVPRRIGDAAKVLADVGGWAIGSLFAIVNVLILSIFMLTGGQRWIEQGVKLRPEAERERLRRIFQKTARAISGYVQGALLVGFIAGISTFIVLTILGVEFAAPLAVFAGLMSLIPLVGATIAAVVIGLVTLFTDFPTDTIVWAIWAIVYQQIENNLIQPQVQKRTVQVQPIIVLVAVLFGSTLIGVIGAIVAIPIAATVQIVAGEWWEWRQEQREQAIVDPPADGDPPTRPTQVTIELPEVPPKGGSGPAPAS